MPKRVPLGAIGVTRGGKTVYPDIGKPFDFTSDEVDQINALQKASGNLLFRKLVNEDQQASDSAGDSNESHQTLPVDYSKNTVVELKAIAAERSIDLGEATKKDDIVAVLVAADKAAAEEEDL